MKQRSGPIRNVRNYTCVAVVSSIDDVGTVSTARRSARPIIGATLRSLLHRGCLSAALTLACSAVVARRARWTSSQRAATSDSALSGAGVSPEESALGWGAGDASMTMCSCENTASPERLLQKPRTAWRGSNGPVRHSCPPRRKGRGLQHPGLRARRRCLSLRDL